MKGEFHKIFKLFEELEEAGESATLTISSKGGVSSIKLQLESSPSSPSTGTTLPSASGRRRRHRGAAARARRRQRAADHQASLLVAPPSASPPPPGEAIDFSWLPVSTPPHPSFSLTHLRASLSRGEREFPFPVIPKNGGL